VVYDVAMHRLPVVFCLDRAGITGDDGASHHGVYDLALFTKVPGMTVLAPSSSQDLQVMLHDALELCDGPVMIRYPKGPARQVAEHEIGVGLHARRMVAGDGSVCILAVGKSVVAAEKAVSDLDSEGISATLWDVRCCLPLDPEMLDDARHHRAVVTIEDGIADGGVGQMIEDDLGDSPCRVAVLGVPTKFLAQGKPERILANLGLDADGVARTVRETLAACDSPQAFDFGSGS
jgi:1-deoxy-D-xylulose-5-phosphate synthase